MSEREMSDDEATSVAASESLCEESKTSVYSLLPDKSKAAYELSYDRFITWKNEQRATSFSQTVLLSYFSALSKKWKPSTLWSEYSKVAKMLKIKHKLDLHEYRELKEFLKKKAVGYRAKKSKKLTSQNIENFLNNAPDSIYLATKVAMIFSVSGDCRKDELIKIETTHLKTYHEATDTRKKRPILVVHVLDTKTKKTREFEIRGKFYDYYLRYSDLRPDETSHNRFFINYHKGRCTTQPIGERKFAFMPKEIAMFLKLPNPESYTGHASRETSETVLEESGAEINAVKQNGGWKSTTVAEAYVKNSTIIKEETSDDQIPSFFHVNLPSSSDLEDTALREDPEDTALRENPFKIENELDLPFEDDDNSSGNFSNQLNIEEIHDQLRSLMSGGKENSIDNIRSWITANVGERASEPEFIKILMTAILEVSIEPYDDKWRFRVDKFHNLQALIPLYIDPNIKLSELQCLIAIQEYIRNLKNPQRILLEIVEKQIFESIISFDSSDGSGSTTDITRLTRKSVALLALKSFFSSLYEADGESTSHDEI